MGARLKSEDAVRSQHKQLRAKALQMGIHLMKPAGWQWQR